MRYVFVIISCCLLFSCSDSFINHKLKFEKIGVCTAFSTSINMISNINGERFEFFSCIDDGFDGQHYTVDRNEDSIVVSFPKTASANKALYKLTLDIDAKPPYRRIVIDGRSVAILRYE